MNQYRAGVGALVVVLILAGCDLLETGSPRDSDWPQFRGADGVALSDAFPLPTRWADGSPNIRWQASIPGTGNSSPVVAGGRVYLTSVVPLADAEGGELTRMAFGLDLETGELLWQTELFSAPPHATHRHNTHAAPSPVTDGRSVWAYFGSHLSRLDRDGTLLWNLEIDPEYPRFVRYGVASSPIRVGDLIIVFQDREWGDVAEPGWLAAYDSETGEQVWRQEWSENCCAYSTPILWERDGKRELVVGYSAEVVAHDPRSGERLWSHPHTMLQFVSSLTADGNILCALGGAHNNRGNLCLRVTEEGGETRVEELWRDLRRAPESASPVLYRDKVFSVTEKGVMSAWDPLTGKELWVARLKSRGFRASLVAGDGNVYASSTWGETAVVDAEAGEFTLLAMNSLGEGGNNATPAIAGGCLLLRRGGSLFCVEKESAAAAGAG